MRYSYAIITANLACRHQIGHRVYEQALDGALQWARAISEIGTLPERELSGAVRNIYLEGLACRSGLDAFLHQSHLNIDDPVQLLLAESLKTTILFDDS